MDPEQIQKNFAPIIKSLEELQHNKQLLSFNVISKDLSGLFNSLIQTKQNDLMMCDNGVLMETHENGHQNQKDVNDRINDTENSNDDLSEFGIIRNLLWKRFVHFKRNFRLLICIVVLPILFDIFAMQFVTLRPPGEHDINLKLSTNLYANSMEVYRYAHSAII